MKNVLVFTAVVLLACGCKRSESPIPVAVSLSSSQNSNAKIDPAPGIVSPFNDAGGIHNAALIYVLNKVKNIETARLPEVQKAAMQYAIDSLRQPLPDNAVELLKELIADDKNSFNNLIEKSTISPLGKTYARQLVRLLLIDADARSVDQKKAAIIALEEKIRTDAPLDKAAQRSLLSAASVARYSLDYWMHSPGLPAKLNIFVASHDVIGTLLFGVGFGAFASAAARAVQVQNWDFFIE